MFKQHESITVKILESSFILIGDGIMTVGIATYDLKPKSGTGHDQPPLFG